MSPAYTRLQVDDPRQQLLERRRIYSTTVTTDSMAQIAKAIGISKPLLLRARASWVSVAVAT